MKVPDSFVEPIRQSIINEIQVNLTKHNRFMNQLYQLLCQNNYVNSEMDNTVGLVYMYTLVVAEDHRLDFAQAATFAVPQVLMAKAAGIQSRKNEAYYTAEEELWLNKTLKQAKTIESAIALWNAMHKEELQKQETTSGGFKRTIRSVVEPLFGTTTEQSSVPESVNVPTEKKAFSRWGNTGVKETVQEESKPASTTVRKFGNGSSPSLQTTTLETLPTSPVPTINTIPSATTGWSRFSKPVEIVPEEPTDIKEAPVKPDTPTNNDNGNTKMDEPTEYLPVLSTKKFLENKMKYKDHQLYTIFGIGQSKILSDSARREKFMGILGNVKLVEESVAAAGTLEAPSLVMAAQHPIVLSVDQIVDKTIGNLVDAEVDQVSRENHVTDAIIYRPVVTYTDKTTLEMSWVDRPLAALLDSDISLSLGQLHELMVAETKIDPMPASQKLLHVLNDRLTEAVNRFLKFGINAEVDIDSFIDDFEPLLVWLRKHGLNEKMIDAIRGPSEDPSVPANLMVQVNAKLVQSPDGEIGKTVNRMISDSKKDMASRTIFFVEEHRLAYFNEGFKENVGIATPENQWCVVTAKEVPEFQHALTVIHEGLPSTCEQVHLLFSDGYHFNVVRSKIDPESFWIKLSKKG